MEKVYRAAKYIRSSCVDEEMEGRNTLENQSLIIDAYLVKHPDIIVVSEKVDENHSGVFFDRPAFTEMMNSIACGEIDCVIVKDLSRLGRDFIESERHLQHIFPQYGIRFISIGDHIDTLHESVSGNLFVKIQNIMHDYYSRDISTRTCAALSSKRMRGEYVGASPIYGYRRSPVNRNQLEPDDVVKSSCYEAG